MALKAAYPEQIQSVYSQQTRDIPTLDIDSSLDPSPTSHHSLGLIEANENIKAGNLQILENIFLQ
jgi:hypothetical protein